jgi:farnesyl-diphosphate farnesyltransferase
VNGRPLDLLRPVSRSFYVSIRLLPRNLREPVGLAYLLARTTDTIADTSAIDVDLRIEMLRRTAGAIQGNGTAPGEELRRRFIPLQQNEPERNLILGFESCIRNLEALSAQDRADIRALLGTITRGQLLDLTRWRGGFAALANADELREYTYLVAGCVGEFWTRICFRKLDRFANRSESEMLELGRRYGSGLQLVNILRDAGADLRAGRCYFPADELRNAEVAPEDVLAQPAKFLPVYRRWLEESRIGLEAGVDYSVAITPARVRVATSLPALIGARTLGLIDQAGVNSLRERVKVPRSQVRTMIASIAITLAAPDRLRAMFSQLR